MDTIPHILVDIVECDIFYLSQLRCLAVLPNLPDQPSEIEFEKFPLDFVQFFYLILIHHTT